MDPLAQLQDIHLPDQVHNYPLAPGWWLLLICISTLVIYLLFKFVKYWRFNKQKRFALRQLKQAIRPNNQQTIAILKWVTMFYFPRTHCAKLFGQQFQQFLMQQLPQKHQSKFAELCGTSFEHLYQKEFAEQSDEALNLAAQFWLKQALPPKKGSSKSLSDNKPKTPGISTNKMRNHDAKSTDFSGKSSDTDSQTKTTQYEKQGDPA